MSRYKLDSTFIHLPISEALEHLETSLNEVSKQVEELETEKGECEEGMEGLKKVLYEKFGSEFPRFFLHTRVWPCADVVLSIANLQTRSTWNEETRQRKNFARMSNSPKESSHSSQSIASIVTL